MHKNRDIELIKKWLGHGSINIFGRPFAGKDNQAKNLLSILNGILVGGGDILRSKYMTDDIKALMKTGKLIPTEKYRAIVLPFLNKELFNEKLLLLSSVGRWHGEEEVVIKTLKESGHDLKAVIYLNISEKESYRRWKNRDKYNDRGERHDDTEDILKVRLDEFNQKTMPVIEYYKKIGILIEIDGTKTKHEVTESIIKALVKLASA